MPRRYFRVTDLAAVQPQIRTRIPFDVWESQGLVVSKHPGVTCLAEAVEFDVGRANHNKGARPRRLLEHISRPAAPDILKHDIMR